MRLPEKVYRVTGLDGRYGQRVTHTYFSEKDANWRLESMREGEKHGRFREGTVALLEADLKWREVKP